MSPTLKDHVGELLSQIETEGLYKRERVITSTQSAKIEVGGERVLNFCANNYLG
ncbi:MAG: glycine C-acetyltransferase, partial [Mesorhizobium sp.]